MATNSPEQNHALPTLDALIKTLDITKSTCGIPPARAAFASLRVLLAMIMDKMANKQGYVELGESCAHVFQALDRGLNGKQIDELNPSVLGAIEQLTSAVTGIQKKIERGKRNVVSRAFHASDEKNAIAGWGRELD